MVNRIDVIYINDNVTHYCIDIKDIKWNKIKSIVNIIGNI